MNEKINFKENEFGYIEYKSKNPYEFYQIFNELDEAETQDSFGWLTGTWNSGIDLCINNNCEIIILGCTELPLAIPATNSYKGIDGKTIYEHGDIQLIDPVEILAKSYGRESIRHREMEKEILQRAVSIESKQ